MSSVRTTPRVGARPSRRSSPKIACSTSPGAPTVAATRSIASRARSRLLTLTFDISQLPGPRNWAMAGGSNGYRAALGRRQLTPGLISSLSGTAGLPPFISFSTSVPELNSAVHANLLLSVGVGDLADKLGPGHVHGSVDLASFRSPIVLEDFHHQGRVVRDYDARLKHAQQPNLPLGLAESSRGIDRHIGVQALTNSRYGRETG